VAPGQLLAWNSFFLAMARWQQGEQEQARKDYEEAVRWTQEKRPNDEELRRFRAEAEEVLKRKEKKD